MGRLTPEQQKQRDSLRNSSIIGAAILGLITASVAYWILSAQNAPIRSAEAIGAGLVVAVAMYWKNFSTGARANRCVKCGTAFSVSRTDREETLVPSTLPSDENTPAPRDAEYDVIETYTCSNCGNTTTREFTTTRKTDAGIS